MEDGVKLHSKRYCCGRNATVDGDIFMFKGVGGSVGVVKIVEPINPMLNYFEYEILERGNKCAIGIGLGEHSYPLDRMPGWNRNGIGYHADDGRMFYQDGYGKQFGPTCTKGDRMGCGIDFNNDAGYSHCNIFFTKNGEQVGDVVRMKKPVYGLYPIIGMHSRGEKVRYLGHWHRQRSGLQEPMVINTSPSNSWLRSNNIKFTDDGLTLQYWGEGANRKDAGIAQANFCLDRQQHYFEMTLVAMTPGKDGLFAIGLAASTYPLHRFPGMNVGSVWYYACNGHVYKEDNRGEPIGPTCTEGDVMGCGIDFPLEASGASVIGATSTMGAAVIEADSDSEEEVVMDEVEWMVSSDEDDYLDDFLDDPELNKYMYRRKPVFKAKKVKISDKCTVFFTKNGERIGDTECMLPQGGFYPVVALQSQGESVRVNFNPLTG